MLTLFTTLLEKDKTRAIERLIRGSTPRQDFFLMIILSVLMSTFGLLLGSSAVIIGSMLIAPMLYPILSLSLGIIMSDTNLLARSFYTVVKAAAGAILAAFAAAIFFQAPNEMNLEIISRTQPSLTHVMIAIIAGFAASFSLVKPRLSETLPGIAISVALIPPLAVTGIGMAKMNWEVMSKSLILFTINIIGIVFASMITFSMMNFYIKRTEAQKAVIKEDLKVEKEKSGNYS